MTDEELRKAVFEGLDQAYENGYREQLSAMSAMDVADDIIAYDEEIGALWTPDDILQSRLIPLILEWRELDAMRQTQRQPI